jgi:hypothetical protein
MRFQNPKCNTQISHVKTLCDAYINIQVHSIYSFSFIQKSSIGQYVHLFFILNINFISFFFLVLFDRIKPTQPLEENKTLWISFKKKYQKNIQTHKSFNTGTLNRFGTFQIIMWHTWRITWKVKSPLERQQPICIPTHESLWSLTIFMCNRHEICTKVY